MKINLSSEQIRTARINAGLTQKEAAGLIYATERAWSSWESESGSKRRMPPGLFELFLIKTGQHDEYVTSFIT